MTNAMIRFYCLDHPDGKFLDYLFRSRIQTAAAVSQVQQDLHEIRLAGQTFLNGYLHVGIPPHARFSHPTYRTLMFEHDEKQKYLVDLQAQRDEAHEILEHARHYFQYRQTFESHCGTATPIATPIASCELLNAGLMEQDLSPLSRKAPSSLAGKLSLGDFAFSLPKTHLIRDWRRTTSELDSRRLSCVRWQHVEGVEFLSKYVIRHLALHAARLQSFCVLQTLPIFCIRTSSRSA